MIELKLSLDDLRKVTHEVLYNIKLVEALRAAGVPVVGRLIPSAVEYGHLVWAIDEDLDIGDILLIQWYDRGEFTEQTHKKKTVRRVVSNEDDEL